MAIGNDVPVKADVSHRLVQRLEWETLCKSFVDYSYRQSWAYSERLAERQAAEAQFVVVERSGTVLGGANVRIKALPVVGGGIAYVSGGPLVRFGSGSLGSGKDDLDAMNGTLQALADRYVYRAGLVMRVAPSVGAPAWGEPPRGVRARPGWVAAARLAPYRTLVLDLCRPVTDIRSSLHQKWRNCLNAAERQNLTIRSGTDASLLEEFASLYEPFRARKAFHAELGADFYTEVQRRANEDERFLVHLAEKDGRVVAGHVSSMGGDTCIYVLGATSEEGLRCKAAYLLQWRTILAAHARGMRWYDLGGIDPTGNPGVYHFKLGMGGVDRSAPGPIECRPRSLRGVLTVSSETLYRRFVHSRARAAGSHA